jgi:hypothetical protein
LDMISVRASPTPNSGFARSNNDMVIAKIGQLPDRDVLIGPHRTLTT